MKSANEILFEHGIDTMSLNDDFNTQLFHAMERYAEAYAAANPKEPEAVHGNEAEKGVCKHKNVRRIFENHECCDCGQLMIL